MAYASPVPPTSSGDGAARQKIDEDIAELEARIISLRTLRNIHTPIGRLHPEIIQEIFLTASRRAQGTDKGMAPLKITWVCKSWRDLALETTALWNYIGSLNPTWIQTFILRAKNRPLEFSYFFQFKETKHLSRITALCLGNLPRIKSLVIRSSWISELDTFSRRNSMWATPAPLLVDLHLETVSLPTNPLAGAFPSLRILCLQRCEFSWESLPIHTGIQELKITGPVAKTSADDVVRKLRVMASNLKKLTLMHTLSSMEGALTADSPAGRQLLESIEHWELSGEPADACSFVLSQFSFPSQLTHAELVLDGGFEQLDTIREFVTARGVNKWPVIKLDIAINQVGNVVEVTEALANSTGLSNGAGDKGDIGGLYQSFTLENFEEDPTDIMPLFHILPLSPIEVLSFSSDYPFDYGSHILAYYSTPEHSFVKDLQISVSYLLTFTPVLHQQNQQLRQITGLVGTVKDQELDDDMKAQCLGIITFHHLRTLRYRGDTDVDMGLAPTYYTILREWFIWRRIVGLGITSLILQEMIVPPKEYITALFADVVSPFECIDVEELDDDSRVCPFHP